MWIEKTFSMGTNIQLQIYDTKTHLLWVVGAKRPIPQLLKHHSKVHLTRMKWNLPQKIFIIFGRTTWPDVKLILFSLKF